MNTAEIIKHIGAELERLEKIKALLAGNEVPARRGRPPGSSKKSRLSPEARAKIAAAQRKRWAKVREKK